MPNSSCRSTTRNSDDRACSQMSDDVARTVAKSIHLDVANLVKNTRLTRRKDGIQLVDKNQIEVLERLGRGTFAEVRAVVVTDEKTGERSHYAMKHLQRKLLKDTDNFRLAGAELALEAHFLGSFDHPNIMRIRGWSHQGVGSFSEGRYDSFFLLLDRLEITLDRRIAAWQKEDEKERIENGKSLHEYNFNPVVDLLSRFNKNKQEERTVWRDQQNALLAEKISIGCQIASAIAYLHERGVIFRDLKPSNVGFVSGNVVQLFDFGLSRELPGCDLKQPFLMTGQVGTMRYMAVEVAMHRPYNVSADVYSWAMVFYEIMALSKPFATCLCRETHLKQACVKGVRPDTSVLPGYIRKLLNAAWAQNPFMRPTAQRVTQKMEALLDKTRRMILNGDDHHIGGGDEQTDRLQEQDDVTSLPPTVAVGFSGDLMLSCKT